MTERSLFWDGPADGSGTGDASIAEYDAATEFAQVMRSFSGSGARTNQGGVFFGELNDLSVTSGGTSPVTVATGRAIVYGTWYETDASVNVTIPTPSGATRIDYIVLRKSWSAQTIRVTRIAGTEGGGAPSLVQTIGSSWDVPLATVSITTGGIITVTDARERTSVLGTTTPTKIKFDVTGTAGAAGFASKTDHVHEIDDPAAPTNAAFNDIAATGSAVDPARRDHLHGMPKLFNKYKTAGQTQAGFGSVSDADLRASVLNGEIYTFEALVIYSSTGSDLDISFSVPGGSTMRWGVLGPDATTPATITGQQTTSGSLTLGADATVRHAQIKGTFTAGANGTFILTWQGTDVTILQYSYLKLMKV